MKNIIVSIFFLAILFSSNFTFSQDKVFFNQLPIPSWGEVSTDPAIPKIAWNRWTTRNFVIHSIDESQGKFLFENIEDIKTWCMTRWGITDFNFSAETMVFCAPNVELMKKLFNLDRSFAEIKIENNKIKVNYLWLILDGRPLEIVPPAVTVICLKEFNAKGNLNMGWWIYRGIPILNSTIPQIKSNMSVVDSQQNSLFGSKSLFDYKEEDWKKLDTEKRQLFDVESALMCLLIRKEFGQNKFHGFLKNNNYEGDVRELLGFTNYAEFDGAFKRYMTFLSADIKQNKTPDSYLLIEPAK